MKNNENISPLTTTNIAILMSRGKVSLHFGKSEEVMLVAVEEGDIKSREILDISPGECGSLIALLKENDAKKIVAGNIGARALERLEAAGINVYRGAKGSVEDALGSLLSGRLVSSDVICDGGMGTCNSDFCKAEDPENSVDPGSRNYI